MMYIPRWYPAKLSAPLVPFGEAEWLLSEADERQLLGMLLYLVRRANEIINQIGVNEEGNGEGSVICQESFAVVVRQIRRWLLWRLGERGFGEGIGTRHQVLNECAYYFDVYPSHPPVDREDMHTANRGLGLLFVEQLRRACAFNILFEVSRYADNIAAPTERLWPEQTLIKTVLNGTQLLGILYGAPSIPYLDGVLFMIDSWDGGAIEYLRETGLDDPESLEDESDVHLQLDIPLEALNQAWTEVFNAGFLRRMWEIP